MTEITNAVELDVLPVGSVVLDVNGDAWQSFSDQIDGSAWWGTGSGGGAEYRAERLKGPFTLLHAPDRDLLAEARTTAVMDYMARKEIPRVEISNPEQIRPFIAQQVAEAEARGYERGRREALTEAADAVGPELANEVGGHTSTYSVRRWLRARAAETPGGAA